MSPNELEDNLTRLLVCGALLLPILLPLGVGVVVWKWMMRRLEG